MRDSNHPIQRSREIERHQRAARRERASALRLALARRGAVDEQRDVRREVPAALALRTRCLLQLRPSE